MKILYLDCFSGISGDMLLASLLDAGLNFSLFKKELSKLGLDSYRIEKKKARRGSLSGTKFSVIVKKEHTSRKFSDIEDIIRKSRLSKDIKKDALDIFRNLAAAEAKAHGTRWSTAHMHEVANIDSIVDVVGIAIALKLLKIRKVYSSAVRLGKGRTRVSHGVIPIPAPATMNLLREAPVRFTNIRKELVTPTGAAALRTLARGFGEMPKMKVLKVGYGAGARELKGQPNMLRAVIGEASPYLEDTVSVVETNIDDMNPQFFESVCRKLFKAGALEVFLSPVFMKKFRPGVLLTVLCKNELVNKISSVIFSETTSIGVRFYHVRRNKLERFITNVRTRHGAMRAKFSFAPDLLKIRPEYDDAVKITRGKSIPLKKIYEEFVSN